MTSRFSGSLLAGSPQTGAATVRHERAPRAQSLGERPSPLLPTACGLVRLGARGAGRRSSAVARTPSTAWDGAVRQRPGHAGDRPRPDVMTSDPETAARSLDVDRP